MKFINTFKKYWYLVTTAAVVLALIPLYSEDIYKALFLTIIVLAWGLVCHFTKKFVLASVFLLFFILPFNITYQLPYSLFGVTLSSPFVDGVIVNYLIPTISVLDLGVFLLLLSLIFGERLVLKWKGFSFLKIFLLLLIYLIVQSILVGDFLSIFNSFRLLLYVFSFYQLFLNIKGLFSQKALKYLLVLSVFSVLFQGIVALLQFSGGASLGLSFLGESHVVSGMMGSSFLVLKDSLYLRGYGTFPHPNVFSGWLIFYMFLGWYLFESLDRKRDYAIALMTLSSLVLVLTFSRIGLLVCGIVWVLFLVNLFVRINKGKSFAFFGLLSERITNLLTSGDTSWSDRVGLTRSSFEVIKNNLLVGVGLGRFVSSMGDTVPRSSNGILLLQPAHNVFLLCIAELGVIGFVLLSSLLSFFLKNRKFSVRLIGFLVCFLIIGLFDHYLFSLPQGLVIFLFLLSCC